MLLHYAGVEVGPGKPLIALAVVRFPGEWLASRHEKARSGWL